MHGLYCIVLKGWSLLPNALRPFEIHCALPNLGIRTWVCRLNFAQWPIFSGLKFFNEPEISLGSPQLKVPLGGLVLRIFTFWKNSSDLSRVWTCEPWNSRRARYPETTGLTQCMVTDTCLMWFRLWKKKIWRRRYSGRSWWVLDSLDGFAETHAKWSKPSHHHVSNFLQILTVALVKC